VNSEDLLKQKEPPDSCSSRLYRSWLLYFAIRATARSITFYSWTITLLIVH